MFLSRFCWGIAGVALIHKGDFDMAAGHFLNGLSQFADLCPVLLI